MKSISLTLNTFSPNFDKNLRNSSERSVEEDQFTVACEGKLTFLTEAFSEPKIKFSPTLCSGENVKNEVEVKLLDFSTLSSDESIHLRDSSDKNVEEFHKNKITKEKEGIPRKVTKNKNWIFKDNDYFYKNQINLVNKIFFYLMEILTYSPEQSVGENEFCGNEVEEKFRDSSEKSVKENQNFENEFEKDFIFGSGDGSTKNVNFASTSFPQNSFLPTLRFNENVILPSQATANWSSSTLRSEELVNNPLTVTKKGTVKEEKVVLREIYKKISGYKYQDCKKNIYNSELFVNILYVLKKLIESNLKCYYCNENVNVIYENRRDPTQWSLERINNSEGHNCNNVVIACLKCNLRRKTMMMQRYVETKQMIKVIKLS